MSVDPVRIVWDALERCGYGPHGHELDFRARCPAHDGDNPTSLHVCDGVDGRAVLYCFAHKCPAENIVAAVGLSMCDLFPPGHKKARRLKIVDARRRDFAGNARALVNVLKALEEVGAYWDVEVRCDCQHCGSPAALLRFSGRYASLSCPGDTYADGLGYQPGACTLHQFQQALAARLLKETEEAA